MKRRNKWGGRHITEKRERVKEEAEARIRQQQLEEKIALQERLLEQSEATRQALKAAEEANRAKTNFLSNMSHEIRTPINYLPKEKVQLVTEEGTAPPPEKTSDILPTALFELEAIDPVSGIEYCGSEEDYMETLAIFSASIGSKSNKIEKAWQEQDLKNYTILVHSLKSTSRIVGAKALSELAFQLEMAGKEANAGLIEEKTPQLLELYRSLQEPLDEILDEWED